MVVVGNKTDLAEDEREVLRAEVETLVMFDWNSGYLECSAKLGGEKVKQVFLELLQRVRNNALEAGPDTANFTANNVRRRKSLPQVVGQQSTNLTF